MKTTVNKDGSITTSIEDETPAPAETESPKAAEAPKEAAEAKVVKTPAKAAPKARSTAESK